MLELILKIVNRVNTKNAIEIFNFNDFMYYIILLTYCLLLSFLIKI